MEGWKDMLLAAAAAKSLQSCPTLCDPMDCSLPGFSVHGILQARTLEWVAIPKTMHINVLKIPVYIAVLYKRISQLCHY